MLELIIKILTACLGAGCYYFAYQIIKMALEKRKERKEIEKKLAEYVILMHETDEALGYLMETKQKWT